MAYNQPYYGSYYPQFNNGAMPDALNQFKGAYQPQPQMQMPMGGMPQGGMHPVPNNDMIWVLGEVEATSYPVAPNNTVTLWDKNQPTIYIKSANAQGVPSMRILDFSERAVNAPKTSEHTCKCGDKFVPKESFKELESKMQDLLARIEEAEQRIVELSTKTMAKSTKKVEVGENG